MTCWTCRESRGASSSCARNAWTWRRWWPAPWRACGRSWTNGNSTWRSGRPADRLEADPARLEQVLANLLTNAAKYTPPGGNIVLTVEREGGEAVVRVRDNGIGIRPEMLTHIFETLA